MYSLCDNAYNSQNDDQKQQSPGYPEDDGQEICTDKQNLDISNMFLFFFCQLQE